jgi:hypothetical protein
MVAIKYPANRDLRDLIKFSFEQGQIWLGESRMLMMHAASMGALRRDLIQLIGRHHARNIFTRRGYLSGQHDAELAKRIRGHATPLDAFVVGPQMHMLMGCVKVTPRRVEFDPDGRHFYGEFEWKGSWEAECQIKEFGNSNESECRRRARALSDRRQAAGRMGRRRRLSAFLFARFDLLPTA